MKICRYSLLTHLIVGLILLVGCSDQQKPDDLIPEDQYIKLIVELQLVESAADEDTVDTKQLLHRIYKKYDIDQEQFIRSHRYYSDEAAPQKKRIKQALKLLREARERQTDSTDSSKTRLNAKEKSPL